jgi:isocitrate dehydrogenase
MRKEFEVMRHPSAPNSNGQPHRTRTRGAIRTHLGRKRSGPRARTADARGGVSSPGELTRREQEDLFDRLMGQFQALFDAAGERTAAAFDAALDTACNTLVSAGEFTVDGAERLRNYLRRDLLHRDHPTLTFRTGDITTAGTIACDTCGWTIRTTRTTLLPSCPQCGETAFRKGD